MCKCTWLKKLLGLKKECCCCHTDKSAPVAPVSPAAPVNVEKTEEKSVQQ